MITIPAIATPGLMMVRWTARTLGLLLLLFWGAFFVEHLVEWFSSAGPTPPMRVVWISLAHLVMLAGFLVAWKRELAGSVMIVIGALAFFSQAAGRNFPLFFGISVIPAVLYFYYWWETRT